MPKMAPYDQAKVAERNGFVIGDEKGVARGRFRGRQVLGREHVRIGDIGYIRDIPHRLAIADDERSFVLEDAGMDGWD
jgi:hypothetical protein